MEHIWAPWRIEYIMSEEPEGCILCGKPGEDRDAENHILHRGKENFVMLNRYPYNPGHLLVSPYRHVGELDGMTETERNEHFEMVSRCLTVLREVFKPGGFNGRLRLCLTLPAQPPYYQHADTAENRRHNDP